MGVVFELDDRQREALIAVIGKLEGEMRGGDHCRRDGPAYRRGRGRGSGPARRGRGRRRRAAIVEVDTTVVEAPSLNAAVLNGSDLPPRRRRHQDATARPRPAVPVRTKGPLVATRPRGCASRVVSRRRPAADASVTWRDGVHLTDTPIWCDARRRRDVCFVSSADRIGRAGHGQLIGTATTLALIGAQGDGHLAVPLRRRFTLGTLRLELVPSGRGLGAAALLVDNAGHTVLYAGRGRTAPGDGPASAGRGAHVRRRRRRGAVRRAAPRVPRASPQVAARGRRVDARAPRRRRARGARDRHDAALDALEVARRARPQARRWPGRRRSSARSGRGARRARLGAIGKRSAVGADPGSRLAQGRRLDGRSPGRRSREEPEAEGSARTRCPRWCPAAPLDQETRRPRPASAEDRLRGGRSRRGAPSCSRGSSRPARGGCSSPARVPRTRSPSAVGTAGARARPASPARAVRGGVVIA